MAPAGTSKRTTPRRSDKVNMSDIDILKRALQLEGQGRLAWDSAMVAASRTDINRLQGDELIELRQHSSKGRMVLINDEPYLLDLRFRMLTNLELARAMGFNDEETTYEFTGNISEVTKQIGNAVPVHLAAALVTAILQEKNGKQ